MRVSAPWLVASSARPLTPQQQQVLGVVAGYHSATGEAAPASYVARRVGVTHERVRQMFRTLFELGRLRGPSTPALPVDLEKIQLPEPAAGEQHPAVAKRAARPVGPNGEREIDLPALSFRADVVPATWDEDEQSVEVVFTTGAAVMRYDWWNDEHYMEELSLEPEHVRLERINSIGAVLDAHSAYSVADQIGAVVPGSVRLLKSEGRARLRFSRRPEVAGVRQDVKDGILRTWSVGYRAYRYEETPPGPKNAMLIRKATDWEPYEISAAPIPADAGAVTRSAQQHPGITNACAIVVRGAQERAMNEREQPAGQSETIVAVPPAAPAPAAAASQVERNDLEIGAQAERQRVLGIRNACLSAKMPRAFEERLIREGLTLERAQTLVLDELRARGGDERGPVGGPQQRAGEVIVGDDPLVHVRSGIENALLHRAAPELFKLDENGRNYRGMSLMRIAEALLHARQVRTSGMAPLELAGIALGINTRGGMHTTSDFAILLGDVANKVLRQAYEEAPQTFKAIGSRVTLSDFKPSNRVQLGNAPALLEVKEHGEFKRGTIKEGKEVFQLSTYGRVFAITRQALINDDTDAFSRIALLFGRSARTLESDLVWAQITGNPVMGDGTVLFHANHGNLDAAPSVISVASLTKARAAMRVQKDLDGLTLLNIVPQHLVVPAALETVAQQHLVQITAQQTGNVNPFAGTLTAVVEPRLDAAAGGTTAWYLAADPGQVDIVWYAYLEGQEGPMTESRIGFDVDGVEIKARHDFAAKAADWRGLYKNPGV